MNRRWALPVFPQSQAAGFSRWQLPLDGPRRQSAAYRVSFRRPYALAASIPTRPLPLCLTQAKGAHAEAVAKVRESTSPNRWPTSAWLRYSCCRPTVSSPLSCSLGTLRPMKRRCNERDVSAGTPNIEPLLAAWLPCCPVEDESDHRPGWAPSKSPGIEPDPPLPIVSAY